jgi:multiple sugar transport system substrate-binding protein
LRKRIMMVLVPVIAISVSACGFNSSDKEGSTSNTKSSTVVSGSAISGKNAEPVTIRTNIFEKEMSNEQIKEFEKANPNIKIEREMSEPTKLAAQIATGDAPDIIRTNGVVSLSSYVIRGLAMDLSNHIKNSTVIKEEDLLPVTNVYRFDGKTQGQGPIYGLPKDWSPDFTVWYNKKLFDAAKIQVPDASKPLTWSQLFDLAHKLTISEGGIIKQYGLSASGVTGKTEADIPYLMQYLLSKGVKVFSSDFGQADFARPEANESLAQWVKAVKGNYGPNQVNKDKSTWSGETFMNEKAAMLINGYWFSAILREDEKAKKHMEDYGMLPAPIADGGQRVSPTGTALGAIINKNTKHPEEAWKVFEWYFGGKPAEDRATSGWGVPVLKHLLPLIPQQTDFDKRVYKVLNDEMTYSGKFLEVNPFLMNSTPIFNKYMTQVYFDKSTLDDALENLNRDMNLLIKEGMNAASSK